MRGIGVRSEGDLISYRVSTRAEPGASRFDCCRSGRVGNMCKQNDAYDNEDKYEQDRT